LVTFPNEATGCRRIIVVDQALGRVEEKLREGHTRVVGADIKSYFDMIPHEQLIKAVSQRIADGKVIKLIESYLKAGVMETLKEWKPTGKGKDCEASCANGTREKGVRAGSIRPWLSVRTRSAASAASRSA